MIYVSICDDNEIVAQKMKFLICKELSLRGIEFKCNIIIKKYLKSKFVDMRISAIDVIEIEYCNTTLQLLKIELLLLDKVFQGSQKVR